MLDIRLPIGGLFLVVGLLLAGYGLVTPAAMYQISLGYNLNLLWGSCMAVFGALMLLWKVLSPQEDRASADAELIAAVPAEPARAIGDPS